MVKHCLESRSLAFASLGSTCRSSLALPSRRGATIVPVNLYDPDGYVVGPPHADFERLRREDPVHRQDMPDGTFYWAILRHADVVHVARHPVLFSAALGGVVLEDLAPETLEMMRDMVLAMDPPRHIS